MEFLAVKPGSSWDPVTGILRTRFPGPAGIAQVVSWRAGLYAAAACLSRETTFKLLVDTRGYNVAEIDPLVHKVQREVIPLFLATHHFRTGLIEFFGLKGEVTAVDGDARCLAVAHVHHECPRTELYRQAMGRDTENFFCLNQEAEAWLAEIPGSMLPEIPTSASLRA